MAGQSHAFAQVTDTDHRGWLWITIICCVIISFALLLFRGVARYRKYGLDDLAIVASFVFVMAHSALLIVSLEMGFGTLLTPASKAGIIKSAKLVFASRIMLTMALWASKLSALFLIRRLIAPGDWRTCVCNAGIVLISIWCIFAILTTSIACSPTRALLSQSDNACQHLEIRISTTTAFNIATELGVFGLAIAFLKHMHVEPQQRYYVLAAFLTRLINIALSLTYLITLLTFLRTGTPSISLIPTTILQQILATTSLITSISSSFFPFTLPIFLPSLSIELQNQKLGFDRKRNIARRLSTPMSFFGDRMRGDREVFRHRARVEVGKGRERGRESCESLESRVGIVREETFEIKTARFSAAGVLDSV